jgi:rhodanese-related sulfurtransferase
MFGWGVPSITTDELAEKLSQGKKVLIDVREPYEFAGGHIKGAVNMPVRQLGDKIGKFKADAEMYVICASGSRSGSAVGALRRAGFENVFNVKGGVSRWRGKLVR